MGGYVIHDGSIYGNHKEGTTCLDLETGVGKWFTQEVGKRSICWADGSFHEAERREGLEILDRVGGGDGFAAGVVHGLLSGAPLQRAVALGVAHGRDVAPEQDTGGANGQPEADRLPEAATSRTLRSCR